MLPLVNLDIWRNKRDSQGNMNIYQPKIGQGLVKAAIPVIQAADMLTRTKILDHKSYKNNNP